MVWRSSAPRTARGQAQRDRRQALCTQRRRRETQQRGRQLGQPDEGMRRTEKEEHTVRAGKRANVTAGISLRSSSSRPKQCGPGRAKQEGARDAVGREHALDHQEHSRALGSASGDPTSWPSTTDTPASSHRESSGAHGDVIPEDLTPRRRSSCRTPKTRVLGASTIHRSACEGMSRFQRWNTRRRDAAVCRPVGGSSVSLVNGCAKLKVVASFSGRPQVWPFLRCSVTHLGLNADAERAEDEQNVPMEGSVGPLDELSR